MRKKMLTNKICLSLDDAMRTRVDDLILRLRTSTGLQINQQQLIRTALEKYLQEMENR